MHRRSRLPNSSLQTLALAMLGAVALSACSDHSRIKPQADTGTQPQLVEADPPWLPTVKIAPATGWPEGGKPITATGLAVQPFARDLDHPRWLHVLPNGDVLVAETNAPPKPEDGQGLKGWAMKLVMKWAGAGTPSANRITLLRDTNGDGVADVREVFLEGLNSPFGMALVGEHLYVANTDAVVEFPYQRNQTRITAAGRRVAALPAGPINHHWTKGLIASPDGSKLYVSVGSNSNIAERGMGVESQRASILEIDRVTGASTVFADGLRNPVGMAWGTGGRLWTVVNERDELGSDLVPDYLTQVGRGDFYGWPWWWYGTHRDTRVEAPAPAVDATTVAVPAFALGSHVAPLGLVAAGPSPVTAALGGGASQGMFVGLHGSWNRRPLAGYKVVWVAFADGHPVGAPVDVLGGFVSADDKAWGRPVGVAVDGKGQLLVADDVGNAVWQVSAAR